MIKNSYSKSLVSFLLSLFLIGGCSNSIQTQPSKEPTEPFAIPASARPVSSGKFKTVTLSDLDNDGNADLVAAGSQPTMLTISYGDGQGRLLSPETLATRGDILSLAVGDVTGDGVAEIVIGQGGRCKQG